MSHLTGAGSFSYKIQLNGLNLSDGVVNVRVNGGGGGGGGAPMVTNVNALLGQMTVADGPMGELMSDTNFTGTYTLAKK